MAEIEKKTVYTKVTVDTPLAIDFEYWSSKEPNWRTLLSSYLCEEHQSEFSDAGNPEDLIDIVDPVTGEVEQKDVLIDRLYSHCAQMEGFVPENGPLTECVFREFLARKNEPASSAELAEIMNKNANTILKTLTSRIYRGIRPA